MLANVFSFENVVDMRDDAHERALNAKLTEQFVLFVSIEADWCPVWRICFSTLSLKAKIWFPFLISSQWVTVRSSHAKDFLFSAPLTNTWTWSFTRHTHQHALAPYSIVFPQSLCNPVSQDPKNLGTIYRNRHTYIIHSEQKWVFSSCCAQTDA